jgi:multiple sugar transport system substrate-binding protein
MNRAVHLTGIAWDHSRAFPPLVATAQRYEEIHPGVRIHWQKRSLDEFGHAPIDVLAEKFDLIVIDHPWAGFCFEKQLVFDLFRIAPAGAVSHLKQNSIGQSFASYVYQDQLLALPIDAATPAPSWRADLMERAGVQPPQTWGELVALARRKLAIIPGFNADLFLHFVMLVNALGAAPFASHEEIAPLGAMQNALELLRELTEPMPRDIFELSPILAAERMTTTDDFAWNACAYTYNNYARSGFARKPLQFGNLPSLEPGGAPLRSVLGGTGLAISTKCKNIPVAVDYTLFVAYGNTQKTIYVQAGGQPAHGAAWSDRFTDELCGGFFNATRAAQAEAIVRPRYSGYVPLQTQGGVALQEYLRDGHSLAATLDKLNSLYRASRQAGSPLFQIN